MICTCGGAEEARSSGVSSELNFESHVFAESGGGWYFAELSVSGTRSSSGVYGMRTCIVSVLSVRLSCRGAAKRDCRRSECILFCFFSARTGETGKKNWLVLGRLVVVAGGVAGVWTTNGERLKSALITGVRFGGVAGPVAVAMLPFGCCPWRGGVLRRNSVRWIVDGSTAGSEI